MVDFTQKRLRPLFLLLENIISDISMEIVIINHFAESSCL